MDLSIRIGNLELANPVVIASGPPGINGAAIKRMAAGGPDGISPGAIVTKSIDLVPSPGQRLSLSYAQGGRKTLVLTDLWSTYSLETWCEREIKAAKEGGVPVIVSLQAVSRTPGPDTARMACMAVEAGADAIELSAFGMSPNVIDGLGIGAVQDAGRTYEVIRAAKQAVRVPVIAKILPEPSNLIDLVTACEAAGADAIASRDSVFPAMAFDIRTRKPRVARTFGSWMPELSGRAIKEMALGYVVEIFRRSSLPIIAVGGVMTWEDAVEMIIGGATGVGICTAAMVEGPKVAGKFVKGIRSYLAEQGTTLTELRGSGLAGMAEVNALADQELAMRIDQTACNQCGVCLPVCPVEAIYEDAGRVYIAADECIACAFCAENCARHAIHAVTI